MHQFKPSNNYQKATYLHVVSISHDFMSFQGVITSCRTTTFNVHFFNVQFQTYKFNERLFYNVLNIDNQFIMFFYCLISCTNHTNLYRRIYLFIH
jgi:hypothetical protein